MRVFNLYLTIIVIFLLVTLGEPVEGVGQRTGDEPLTYELARAYPSVSINQDRLAALKTLSQINKYYKSSWIKEFKSVEVIAQHADKKVAAIGRSEELTSDQLSVIQKADEGSEILINITYIPDNTLSHNDPKEFNYSFTIEPDQDATYVGGESAVKKYLQRELVDKIPTDSFTGYAMAAVKFTIDEEGRIYNAQLFEPTKDETLDDIILSSICNVPNWIPATYKSGVKVKQDFALIVGSLENCMIPILNVRREDLAVER